MPTTDIFLKGALEPLRVREPLQATALNMSAGARNGLLFFGGTAVNGDDVMVAINAVLYMREVES